MRVEYDSNNSGGGWWLKDEHWFALERAGWKIDWCRDSTDRLFLDDDGRFLGTLAMSANRYDISLAEAINEFERVTGCNASARGCSCCGQPHFFRAYDDDGHLIGRGPELDDEGNDD